MFTKMILSLSIVCMCFIVGCGESNGSGGGHTIIGGGGGGDDNPKPIGEPEPVPEPVDGKLERGSRVKVTNTIVDGVDERLHIRNPEGIESDIIGSAGDGATGTILNGPSLGDGWIWWEIDWDDNGKVAFGEGVLYRLECGNKS